MALFSGIAALVLRNTSLFRGRLSNFNWDTRLVSLQDAHALVRGNPQLHTILISHARSQEVGAVASLGSSLRELNLIRVSFLSDGDLTLLTHACPSLMKLSIHGFDSVHHLDGGVIALAEGCCKLERVDIVNFFVSRAAVNALCEHCFHLTELQLPYAALTTQSVVSLSRSGALLQKVSIGWAVDSLADAVLSAQCFESVRELNIDAITPTNASSLAHAMSNMPELVTFTIGGPVHGNGISAPTALLARALRHCVNLTNLSIHQQLSDDSREGLCSVLGACPVLRSITVGSCPFADDFVLSLAAHCRGLLDMIITAAWNLTDVAIMILAAQCPQLRTVIMGNAAELTDATLQALAQHCPCLSTISLPQSTHLTISGIRQLVLHCTNLTHVSVPKRCWGDSENEIIGILVSRIRRTFLGKV
jgi:hypothetical protein